MRKKQQLNVYDTMQHTNLYSSILLQEIDSRLDLHNMKAEPINPVPHGM